MVSGKCVSMVLVCFFLVPSHSYLLNHTPFWPFGKNLFVPSWLLIGLLLGFKPPTVEEVNHDLVETAPRSSPGCVR